MHEVISIRFVNIIDPHLINNVYVFPTRLAAIAIAGGCSSIVSGRQTVAKVDFVFINSFAIRKPRVRCETVPRTF